ncbi:hypothetical protein B0T20DRAFT_402485 [Sordaria brevicollis]|uniref:Uncharacterized protein n=1 Tax=Sordaria brevicollis TaxID=83679 RepID=A0AAE0PKY0_SORBR|nr:hypothetical protein B0T20DRAFT_402485 [Sordaria brevicollis]
MPAFIKPGCDSRHRFACKALFRALLRAGYRVPLPHDVATALDEKQNPIRALIRNGFRRNSSEISLRLVNSALNKGYRFLELLTQARDESSPAHADVLQFLRENNERVLAIREKKRQEEEKLKKRWGPNPDNVPLLTKIPNPSGSGPPTFVPTVRPLPLEKLSGGVRKVPTLDELGGHAFLRLRKPQSEYLGRVLSQKFQRRQRWADKYQELVSEDMPDAEQEDAWDDLVEDMLRGEPQPWDDPRYYTEDGAGRQKWTQNKQSARRSRTDGGSYAHAIKLAMADIERKQKLTMQEMVARGRALWKLVLEERALAEKEKKSRKRREKIQRKRERRRVAKEERKKARMSRIMRQWRLKTQERKKKEKAERETLRIEEEARQPEEARFQETAAVTTATIEQQPGKVEATEEGRLRGSQALKATRQVKKTNASKPVLEVKDTESTERPAESAKEPGSSPEVPTSATPVPKRRGRPKKVDSETPATQFSPEPETPAPKKRGRPRKVATPAEEETPKKRGRPRKVAAAAAPEEQDNIASTGSSHKITDASHHGGGGVSRDAFPPTALHPTGRNQHREELERNREDLVKEREELFAKWARIWRNRKKREKKNQEMIGRFRGLKEAQTETLSTAGSSKPLITTTIGRPKISPPAAATLLAKARIQSLLLCELYRYYGGPRWFESWPRIRDAPLHPLAVDALTTDFSNRIVKLPSPLANKTTASAAKVLGLNLGKANVLWNGEVFKNKAAASEKDGVYIGQIDFGGYHWGTDELRAARNKRRVQYSMDLWAKAVQEWVMRGDVQDELNITSDRSSTWWWPDPTPESREIVAKGLALAVLDELVRCSAFKYEIFTEQLGDDGSDRLSSLVEIPDRVKSLLFGSSSSATPAETETETEPQSEESEDAETETDTDDKAELDWVVWGGEVMPLEEAKKKDYEMWKVQSDATKKRWLPAESSRSAKRILDDHLAQAEKDKRIIIQ